MDIVDQYTPENMQDATKRILQAFLGYLPSDGQQNLSDHLRKLQTNKEIHDFAEILVNGLLLPLRIAYSNSTKLPRYGPHGTNELNDYTATQYDEPVSKQSELFQLKKQCLERDDHKCLLTQVPKLDFFPQFKWTERMDIIPFSLGIWKDDADQHAKEIVWKNLLLCFPALEKDLGLTQHSLIVPQNAMTMDQKLHQSFGNFDFTFERTSTPHHYQIKNYRPNSLTTHTLPKTVTFESHDNRFALPSPELLKIHATIVKIFYASARGVHIEKCLFKLENNPEISGDGSTDLHSILAATWLGALATESSDPQDETRAAVTKTQEDEEEYDEEDEDEEENEDEEEDEDEE